MTVDRASARAMSRDASGGAKRRRGEDCDTRRARWRRSSQLSPSWSARWEISAYRRTFGRSRSSKTSISRTTNRALTDLQSNAFLIVWGCTSQRRAVSLRSSPFSDISLAKSRPRRGTSSGGFPEDLGCDFPSSTAATRGGCPSVGGSKVSVARGPRSQSTELRQLQCAPRRAGCQDLRAGGNRLLGLRRDCSVGDQLDGPEDGGVPPARPGGKDGVRLKGGLQWLTRDARRRRLGG